MDQFPKHLTVARGDNVSMFCTFPIFEGAPEVSWWKRGEESVLQPDSRKKIYLKKGSSSFEVLNASVADSGMYHCSVKHQQNKIGDGSGSQLTVCGKYHCTGERALFSCVCDLCNLNFYHWMKIWIRFSLLEFLFY